MSHIICPVCHGFKSVNGGTCQQCTGEGAVSQVTGRPDGYVEPAVVEPEVIEPEAVVLDLEPEPAVIEPEAVAAEPEPAATQPPPEPEPAPSTPEPLPE